MNMDRKQIAILALALIVLVGGILIVVSSISKKNQANNPVQPLPINKTEPVNIFNQQDNESQENIAEALGSVEAIGEKTLTIKHLEQKVVVNINGATPVMIKNSASQATVGQMADIKVGEAVEVTYDGSTQETKLIMLMRP